MHIQYALISGLSLIILHIVISFCFILFNIVVPAACFGLYGTNKSPCCKEFIFYLQAYLYKYC